MSCIEPERLSVAFSSLWHIPWYKKNPSGFSECHIAGRIHFLESRQLIAVSFL